MDVEEGNKKKDPNTTTTTTTTTTTYTHTQSSRYGSCFYPFGQNDQRFKDRPSGASSSVMYTVRQSNDPFIALQRLTEGEMDFGFLREDQRKVGVALVIVGGILIAFPILGVIGLCCHVARTRARHAAKANGQHDAADPPLGQHSAAAAYYQHPSNGPLSSYAFAHNNNNNNGNTSMGIPMQHSAAAAYYQHPSNGPLSSYAFAHNNNNGNTSMGIPMQQMPPLPQQQQPNYVTNATGGYGFNLTHPYNGSPTPQYTLSNLPPPGYGYGNAQSGGPANAHGFA